MGRNERPTGVTIASWLVIVVHTLALVIVLLEGLGGNLVVGNILNIACGIAFMKGQNWARWIYLIVKPIGLVLWWVAFGFNPLDLLDVGLYLAVLWFLTRPEAGEFFTGKRAIASRIVEPNTPSGSTDNNAKKTITGTRSDAQSCASSRDLAQKVPSTSEGDPAVTLLFNSGLQTGRSFKVRPGITTIGRAPDNDLVIDDPTVSRYHARITFQNGQFVIQDLGSRSGTVVDGHSAPAATLSSGTDFRLGATSLVFTGAEGAQVTRAGVLGAAHAAQTPVETVVLSGGPGFMAWLAVTGGPCQGQTFQLKSGANTIGRGVDNDVVLGDSTVSRHHAVIQAQDNAFLLLDLGSSSGTSINGQPLKGKGLKPGGTVKVGQSRLRMMVVENPEPQIGGTLSGETMAYQAGGGRGGMLVVESGPDAGKSYPADIRGDTVIGRDRDCNVMLTDAVVSRRHCVVRGNGRGYVVFDLGSRGGTVVDGVTVAGQEIHAGEVVSLGRTQLSLILR